MKMFATMMNMMEMYMCPMCKIFHTHFSMCHPICSSIGG